jgi:hypothetical protein
MRGSPGRSRRAVAADDVGRAHIAAAARRICRCHRARTARLTSLDPLYALLVIVVLVLPYLIWLLRADALAMPPWPAISDLGARHAMGLAARSLVLAMSAIVLLVILNSGWFARRAGDAPIHLPAAGRSAGARLRLFLRHRAGAARQFPGRAVQFSTTSWAAQALRC